MVDKGGEGVELHFEDGSVSTTDLVVGADGIRSVGYLSYFMYFLPPLYYTRFTSYFYTPLMASLSLATLSNALKAFAAS